MPFKMCPVCHETYNVLIGHHCKDAVKPNLQSMAKIKYKKVVKKKEKIVEEQSQQPQDNDKKPTFKEYLERFGVKTLKC